MKNTKMKLWKKLLIVFILVLLIITSVILVRYNILTKLQQKNEKSNDESNCYYYSESEETIMEYWRKDGIMKLNIKHKNGVGDITFWKDTNTDEKFVFWNEPAKLYSKDNGGMIDSLPQGMMFTSETSIRLLLAATPTLSISNKKYNDKDCYCIKIDGHEEIIEKDLGLILFSSNNGNRKVNYKFDNVTDLEVQKPNLEEYRYIENN